MAYLRTVKTASGARAVQIVHGSRRGARRIEHLGSAHDDQELEALKAVARQRLAGGQGELELSPDPAVVGAVAGPGPLQTASTPTSAKLPVLPRRLDLACEECALPSSSIFASAS